VRFKPDCSKSQAATLATSSSDKPFKMFAFGANAIKAEVSMEVSVHSERFLGSPGNLLWWWSFRQRLSMGGTPEIGVTLAQRSEAQEIAVRNLMFII
jgi:hypothetical protein